MTWGAGPAPRYSRTPEWVKMKHSDSFITTGSTEQAREESWCLTRNGCGCRKEKGKTNVNVHLSHHTSGKLSELSHFRSETLSQTLPQISTIDKQFHKIKTSKRGPPENWHREAPGPLPGLALYTYLFISFVKSFIINQLSYCYSMTSSGHV